MESNSIKSIFQVNKVSFKIMQYIFFFSFGLFCWQLLIYFFILKVCLQQFKYYITIQKKLKQIRIREKGNGFPNFSRK